MAIITLLSDWGDKDYYTASVKGAILKSLPDAVIVDITHNVPHFDINYASFILKNVWEMDLLIHYFPLILSLTNIHQKYRRLIIPLIIHLLAI